MIQVSFELVGNGSWAVVQFNTAINRGSTHLLAVLARKRLVFVVHGAGVSRQFVPLLEAFLAELARKRLVVVVDAHHVDP